MRAAQTANRGEISADEYLAFAHAVGRIGNHGKNRSVSADAGVPRSIHAAVVLQASNVGPRNALKVQERAASKEPASAVTGKRLSKGQDVGVSAGTGIEEAVESAIVIEARNMIVNDPIHIGEKAADENAAIGLHEHRADDGVGA